MADAVVTHGLDVLPDVSDFIEVRCCLALLYPAQPYMLVRMLFDHPRELSWLSFCLLQVRSFCIPSRLVQWLCTLWLRKTG